MTIMFQEHDCSPNTAKILQTLTLLVQKVDLPIKEELHNAMEKSTAVQLRQFNTSPVLHYWQL